MPNAENKPLTGKYFQSRMGALRNELNNFIPHYKELSMFVRPRRGRFMLGDQNKGDKRYSNILNNAATYAHQIARSGMMAGTMSPARPWFDLRTFDADLDEYQPVKEWLYKVTTILRDIFHASNFYNQAPTLLGEMLLFGTGCMTHTDDFDDVARFYTHTVGSYMIAQDERYKINTLVREFEWSTFQIVKAFGLDNASQRVKDAWDKGNYDQWFPVVHFLEPNPDYKRSSPLSERKRFRSVYFEPGELFTYTNGSQEGRFLSNRGYDEFPAYVPRWDTTNEDVYGTDCPGMVALGDVKQLQHQEIRKGQGIDKMVNPPLQGPASLRSTNVSQLHGGLTLYDITDKAHKLTPIYDVQLNLQELRADMDNVERRIDRAFFKDMFLAISQMEGIQPRNELDLMTRNEERLLMLGPVLERLQGEFHDSLIDRTFSQCVRADILPEPPKELEGKPLRVKYISTLAMAQRAVATQGIDRLLSFAGNLSNLGWQDVLDKVDPDQAVDEYATAVGVSPRIVRSDDAVAFIRQQRQQEIQRQQQLEAMQSLGNTAKMASDAKMDGDSVLSAITGGQ